MLRQASSTSGTATTGTMSRAAVSRYLSSFVWHAFEGIAAEHGVVVDRQGKLRLVAE